MSITISFAVEGVADAALLRRVLLEAGHTIGNVYIKNGKSTLDRDIHGFNKAAYHSHWIILRDLDLDAECAPTLINALIPTLAPMMRFQIAVRALESWLLADAESLSAFFSISRKNIPLQPDRLINPKLVFINLASQIRKKAVRNSLIPKDGSTAKIGPGYTSLITEFIQNHWDPFSAAERSPSLMKLMEYLRNVA